MIDVVIGCLLGVLGGAVMSPLLHKWLTKKLTKKIRLDKGGFMRIYLPNKLQMTIWDSYSCLLYTSPSPRDSTSSRMPSSA